jgi:hypothetical protein
MENTKKDLLFINDDKLIPHFSLLDILVSNCNIITLKQQTNVYLISNKCQCISVSK